MMAGNVLVVGVTGAEEGVTTAVALWEVVAIDVGVPEKLVEFSPPTEAQLERSKEILMRNTINAELYQVLSLRCHIPAE
jgi:hypothetical protein